MKRIILLSIIFILLFYSYLAAEEIALSLNDALAIALRDNRDVLLKAEEIKKAKAKISEAQAGLLPTLTASGSWTDTRGYYTKDMAQINTQLTLKQYLYKGGKTINTIEQNKDKLTVASALLDKAKLELILNVQKAFYTLLLSNELAKLNEAILDNTGEHIDFVQALYKEGQASESQLLAIKASLASVKQAYQLSLNQAEAGEVLLTNLLYLHKDVKIKAEGQFIFEPKELAYDQAFLKAMQTRPEIRQYEAQLKLDTKAIEIAKSDNRPNIYASWDYYSRSHSSVTTHKGWNDYSIIGLTFSWPIFDGWATKAKVEQAIIDLKETQLTKEKVIKDISLELKNAYLGLKNALAKIESTLSQTIVSEDNLRVARAQYNSGLVSLLDLHDVYLSYDITLFNQKEAIYDYILAKVTFNKATGGL